MKNIKDSYVMKPGEKRPGEWDEENKWTEESKYEYMKTNDWQYIMNNNMTIWGMTTILMSSRHMKKKWRQEPDDEDNETMK